MSKKALIIKIILALIILSCWIQPVPAADIPSNVLSDAYHVNIGTANAGGFYIKFDGGGLNALHITTSTSEPFGQVTTTSLQSGTFYIADTGGRGFCNDMVLMVGIKKPAGDASLPDNMKIKIKSSGFQWEPTGILNKPPQLADVKYVEGAVDGTYGINSILYGPQKWKPAGQNSPKNYPIYYGQDMSSSSDLFYFFFVDLKVGDLGSNSGLPSSLQNEGMIKIEYSIENLDNGMVSFNGYGWCDENQANQGKGISWTNDLTGSSPSGYSVIIGNGGSGEGSGSSLGAIDYGGSGSDSQINLPKVGNLNVTSYPSGAKVFIDGDFLGEVTNASFTDLPVGDYGIYLELENYERTEKKWVSVRAGYVSEENFNLTLCRSSCYIESVPKGADIFLDGKDTLWHTNSEICDIEVGNHTITVSKPGFMAVSKNILIEKDKTALISVILETEEAGGEDSYQKEMEIAGSDSGLSENILVETQDPEIKQTDEKSFNNASDFPRETPSVISVVSTDEGIIEKIFGFVNSLFFGDLKDADSKNTSSDETTGFSATNLKNAGPPEQTVLAIPNSSVDLLSDPLSPEKTGTVYVTSYPENLAIYFDGKDSGCLTPHYFYGVKEGIHKVSVSTAGKTAEDEIWVFYGDDIVVDLRPQEYNKKVDVNFRSKDFKSSQFKIGDKNPEYSFPQQLTVETDTYITVSEEGRYYSFYPGTLINGDDIWVLKNNNFGKVSITSKPDGGEIYVDGYDTGEQTPAVLDTLSEGYHVVQISKDGYYPEKNMFFMVDSKDETDYELRFVLSEYTFGTLSVNSQPEGCSIYLGGSYTGKKTPYNFEYIPIGTYDIMVMYNRTITENELVTVLPLDKNGPVYCNLTMSDLS